MSILNRVFRTAAHLTRKMPLVDVDGVIRSALGQAGLLGPAAPQADAGGPFACKAPAGAPDRLHGFTAPRRKARDRPDAEDAPAPGGSFTWRSIAGDWGTRRFKLFVPASGRPPAGLVVMLHGCSQTPDDFARGTRMNAVAAENDLVVAYPEQIRGANVSLCWNWFDAAHQTRGQGEPALIAAITRAVAAEFHIPAGRIFIAGLSAGGAMAAVMAHTDTALFAAVGVHSGLPYRAASDVGSAFAAMRGDGEVASVAARAPSPGVPAIIFHGDADHTVHVSNADTMVARLSATGTSSEVMEGRTPDGSRYVRTIGRDREGAVRFEDWRLEGAGHAWSGGDPQGSHTSAAGPDASREMVRFFLAQAGEGRRRPARAAVAG